MAETALQGHCRSPGLGIGLAEMTQIFGEATSLAGVASIRADWMQTSRAEWTAQRAVPTNQASASSRPSKSFLLVMPVI